MFEIISTPHIGPFLSLLVLPRSPTSEINELLLKEVDDIFKKSSPQRKKYPTKLPKTRTTNRVGGWKLGWILINCLQNCIYIFVAIEIE